MGGWGQWNIWVQGNVLQHIVACTHPRGVADCNKQFLSHSGLQASWKALFQASGLWDGLQCHRVKGVETAGWNTGMAVHLCHGNPALQALGTRAVIACCPLSCPSPLSLYTNSRGISVWATSFHLVSRQEAGTRAGFGISTHHGKHVAPNPFPLKAGERDTVTSLKSAPSYL